MECMPPEHLSNEIGVKKETLSYGNAPFNSIPLPSMSSEEYLNEVPDLHEEKEYSLTELSPIQKYKAMLKKSFYGDVNSPSDKFFEQSNSKGVFRRLFSNFHELRPRSYTNAYVKPNVCPEECWYQTSRWPRFRYINAKVSPPVNGSYNDYLHYISYKNWFEKEREVYIAHALLVQEMFERCCLKEGKYNLIKNCQHIFNKYFAMTRMEEFNQALLYMSLTGNAAIRETPYPDDFVDQKRKIYNDWLFRTRMRKPTDAF